MYRTIFLSMYRTIFLSTTSGVEFATTEAFCSIGMTTGGIEVTTGEINPNPAPLCSLSHMWYVGPE